MNEIRETRIHRLELLNFRAFADLTIEFDPRLTVLVAENGGGKSTVLDAIAMSLHPFVFPLVGGSKLELSAAHVHRIMGDGADMQPVFPCAVMAWGTLYGEQGGWNRIRESLTGHADGVDGTIMHAWQLMREHLQDYVLKKRADAPLLPLIAYYGSGRLWDGVKGKRPSKKRTPPDTNRFNGYLESLVASSHYRFFADWFERYSLEAMQERLSGKTSIHAPGRRLQAVRQAIDLALAPSGWKDIEWDFAREVLIATHASMGRLAIDELSDGIRNVIGLVGDIAYRSAHLNPHLGEKSALQTPGVVLIDEVDLHLHPRWQQSILSALMSAFPCIQFIVTTHSPQVVSTIPASSVRMLSCALDSTGRAESPRFQTRGVESADILAKIMGVDPVPAVEEAVWVSQYRSMIEDGAHDSEGGRQLRVRLLDHFGETHPIMVDCDRLIRWRALRGRRSASQEVGSHEKA